uniref:Uncharacterized protein n=1 Tax=Arundo donax TaxID=35708 RepID=A0A0A9C3B3_ARUDO
MTVLCSFLLDTRTKNLPFAFFFFLDEWWIAHLINDLPYKMDFFECWMFCRIELEAKGTDFDPQVNIMDGWMYQWCLAHNVIVTLVKFLANRLK